MEIREGIKYEYKPGKIAEVIKDLNSRNKFSGKFKDNSISRAELPHYWRKSFKNGNLKLIEYPYKVGDWVYCTNNRYSGSSTPQITQITNISQGTSLLICVNNESMYLRIDDFNVDWRPCFKDEIPDNAKPKKVIKEDLGYLVGFLDKLNMT